VQDLYIYITILALIVLLGDTFYLIIAALFDFVQVAFVQVAFIKTFTIHTMMETL